MVGTHSTTRAAGLALVVVGVASAFVFTREASAPASPTTTAHAHPGHDEAGHVAGHAHPDGASGPSDPALATLHQAWQRSQGKVSDHATALAQLDAELAHWEGRTVTQPIPRTFAKAASLRLNHHQLTGDLDDLTRAEAHIARAFEVPARGPQPFAERAAVKMAHHHFRDAEPDVEEALRTARDSLHRAGLLAAQGDIDLELGRMQQALERFEEAHRLDDRSTAHVVRLARVEELTGQKDKAAQWLDQALAMHKAGPGFGLGWLLLRRGILELDRGRCDEALPWFERADEAFPGFFLIEEHRAECLTVLGRAEEALALYRRVVQKNPSPEYLDALAGVLDALGQPDEAREIEAQAAAGWKARLQAHPDAVGGHAIDHFLEGEDRALALELARKNVALRPSGEARTKLAVAELRAGNREEAQRLVDELFATPFRHAGLYAVKAVLDEEAGRPDDAARAWADAEHLERGARDGWAWIRSGGSAPR